MHFGISKFGFYALKALILYVFFLVLVSAFAFNFSLRTRLLNVIFIILATFQPLRFSSQSAEFASVLKKRVNTYFTENQIERHANAHMKWKTTIMLAWYWVPFLLIITGLVTNGWVALGLCLFMGMGLAGIGLSVMHDANHGSYSSNPSVNKWLGFTLNMMGATAFNWKVQHNMLHHTYTNVHETDEDVSQRGLFRLNPHAQWKPIHKYQHLYAWFFYGLMTFVWVFFKDITRLQKYQKMGLVKRANSEVKKEWAILIATKLIYFSYALVLPVLVTPFSFAEIFLGFFVCHYIAGFILAIIFQPAHVNEETEYPLPDDAHHLEHNFFVHQMLTTQNFARNNKLFTWYVGGLNYQVEHHLFPNVCHVHYPKIANIVKATAEEFGVPYLETATFSEALNQHYLSLKKFGVKPVAVESANQPLPSYEKVA